MDDAATLRDVQSYCPRCGEVRLHHVYTSDPGDAMCATCGAHQQMMVPIGDE